MTTFIESVIRFKVPSEALTAMKALTNLGYRYDIMYSSVGITHQIRTHADGGYCTYGAMPLQNQSITMQEFLIKHAEANKPYAAIPKSALVHAIAEKEMAEVVDIKLVDPLYNEKMKLPKVNKKKLSAATIFYTTVLIAIAVFIITLYIEWL